MATSKHDYSKAKKDYISSNESCRVIAERYNIPYNTLARIMTKEKWAELRGQAIRESDKKVVSKIADKDAKRIDKIQDTADLLLDKIREGIEADLYTLNAQSVNSIACALGKLKDVKGLKSDLDIQEQTARIDKLRKEALSEEANKDIKIVISGELEEYSK